jgi:hypothetical protein
MIRTTPIAIGKIHCRIISEDRAERLPSQMRGEYAEVSEVQDIRFYIGDRIFGSYLYRARTCAGTVCFSSKEFLKIGDRLVLDIFNGRKCGVPVLAVQDVWRTEQR